MKTNTSIWHANNCKEHQSLNLVLLLYYVLHYSCVNMYPLALKNDHWNSLQEIESSPIRNMLSQTR